MKDLKLIMESWKGWRRTVNEDIYKSGEGSPTIRGEEPAQPKGPPTAEMSADGTCPEGFAPHKGKCVEEGGETARKKELGDPMSTPEKPSMHMPSSDLDAPQYVKILKAVAGTPEFQQIARAGKTDDAGPTDEVFVVTPKVLPVNKLFATQAEIGLGQSLGDQLANPEWAQKRDANPAENALGLKGEPVQMLCTDPRCAIFTFGPDDNGDYRIIDGHHRWSQVMMMNPDAKVAVDNLEPSPVLKSSADMLKLVQLAIAVKAGNVVTKDFKGLNLMGVGEGEIRAAVMGGEEGDPEERTSKYGTTKDGISDLTLDLMVKAGKITEPSKELAAEYIAGNLAAIKANKSTDGTDFTRKNVMPQPSDSGTSQSAVAAALGSGAINFDDPRPSDVKVKVAEARVHKAVRNMLLGKRRRVRQAVRDMLKP